MGKPVSGEHHDLYRVEETLEKSFVLLNEADIEYRGLFLSADSGFDGKKYRDFLEKKEMITNIKENQHHGNIEYEKYFDSELYKGIFKIEKQMLGWITSMHYL